MSIIKARVYIDQLIISAATLNTYNAGFTWHCRGPEGTNSDKHRKQSDTLNIY